MPGLDEVVLAPKPPPPPKPERRTALVMGTEHVVMNSGDVLHWCRVCGNTADPQKKGRGGKVCEGPVVARNVCKGAPDPATKTGKLAMNALRHLGAGRDPRQGKVGQPIPVGIPTTNAACAGQAPEDGEHDVQAAGPLFWCCTCGCYSEKRGAGLAEACMGPPDRRNPCQRGRWRAIIAIKAGKHPKTGLPLYTPLPRAVRRRLCGKQHFVPEVATLAVVEAPGAARRARADDGEVVEQEPEVARKRLRHKSAGCLRRSDDQGGGVVRRRSHSPRWRVRKKGAAGAAHGRQWQCPRSRRGRVCEPAPRKGRAQCGEPSR